MKFIKLIYLPEYSLIVLRYTFYDHFLHDFRINIGYVYNLDLLYVPYVSNLGKYTHHQKKNVHFKRLLSSLMYQVQMVIDLGVPGMAPPAWRPPLILK